MNNDGLIKKIKKTPMQCRPASYVGHNIKLRVTRRDFFTGLRQFFFPFCPAASCHKPSVETQRSTY